MCIRDRNVRVASKPLRMKPASSTDIDAPARKRSFGPPRGDRPSHDGPRKPGGFKPGGFKPGGKPGGFKPAGGKPGGFKPVSYTHLDVYKRQGH